MLIISYQRIIIIIIIIIRCVKYKHFLYLMTMDCTFINIEWLFNCWRNSKSVANRCRLLIQQFFTYHVAIVFVRRLRILKMFGLSRPRKMTKLTWETRTLNEWGGLTMIIVILLLLFLLLFVRLRLTINLTNNNNNNNIVNLKLVMIWDV